MAIIHEQRADGWHKETRYHSFRYYNESERNNWHFYEGGKSKLEVEEVVCRSVYMGAGEYIPKQSIFDKVLPLGASLSLCRTLEDALNLAEHYGRSCGLLNIVTNTLTLNIQSNEQNSLALPG